MKWHMCLLLIVSLLLKVMQENLFMYILSSYNMEERFSHIKHQDQITYICPNFIVNLSHRH